KIPWFYCVSYIGTASFARLSMPSRRQIRRLLRAKLHDSVKHLGGASRVSTTSFRHPSAGRGPAQSLRQARLPLSPERRNGDGSSQAAPATNRRRSLAN